MTQRQDDFCLYYFECGSAIKAALKAGYSTKTADVIASENLTKPKIQERLASLRQKTEDSTVATVLKRKQRLSEIINHSIDAPVSAGHIVAATREINMMERIYEPESRNTYNEIKVLIIREQPKLVPVEGEFKELEIPPYNPPKIQKEI